MGPGVLDKALCGLMQRKAPNLIAGFEKAEDAEIYKLTGNLAIVQTLDFFTPIVDDPYLFGLIAVANALSDVYAMGGKPPISEMGRRFSFQGQNEQNQRKLHVLKIKHSSC